MISFMTSTEPGSARRLRMPTGTSGPATALSGWDGVRVDAPGIAAPKGAFPAVRTWRSPV